MTKLVSQAALEISIFGLTSYLAVIRLLASLALLVYLSPSYEDELGPLLGVLEIEPILVSKADQLRNDKNSQKRAYELITIYKSSAE